MSGSSVEFFADNEDLDDLFRSFDKVGDFKYIHCLSPLNKPLVTVDSALSLFPYTVTHEMPVQSNVFLIMETGQEIFSREIKMKDGSGVKLKVDQHFNKDTIELLLGGEAGASTLVTHTLRTTGETSKSKEIFKSFKKCLLRKSQKVKSFYLMPNAFSCFSSGWRLTQGINYSQDIDLIA